MNQLFSTLQKKQIKGIKDAKDKNYNSVNLTLSTNQILETFNETQKINKKLKSLFAKVADNKDDFKIKQERKEVKKVKIDEKYKQFIADLMKYSSKPPMLRTRKQKVSKVIKSLLEERKTVGRWSVHGSANLFLNFLFHVEQTERYEIDIFFD